MDKNPSSIKGARTARRSFALHCGISDYEHPARIAFFAGVAWAASRLTKETQAFAQVALNETKPQGPVHAVYKMRRTRGQHRERSAKAGNLTRSADRRE